MLIKVNSFLEKKVVLFQIQKVYVPKKHRLSLFSVQITKERRYDLIRRGGESKIKTDQYTSRLKTEYATQTFLKILTIY